MFDFQNNALCGLLGIKYPLIQAGMVWCTGWELVSAVSESGGLGVLGAGSMYPEELENQILAVKKATNQPFAVNLPLIYPQISEHIQLIIKHKVPVVITSAGNPTLWTAELKNHGIKVLHVVANLKFALKAQKAGVDAVIAEGFEAGGHNGKDELTTFVLTPLLSANVSIPVIAAGGIYDGKTMFAAMVLGAKGVQMGSRFVATIESQAHQNFKNKIIESDDIETKLVLKKLNPVRLMDNEFRTKIIEMENKGATEEELRTFLGRGRAKKGMFEGDLVEGELEIGQVAANLCEIKPAQELINDIIIEFEKLNSYTKC